MSAGAVWCVRSSYTRPSCVVAWIIGVCLAGAFPLSACSDTSGEGHGEALSSDAGPSRDARASSDDATAPGSNRHDDPPPGCSAPPGVSTSPHTIADVVTLLNALPKPVTIPCFLESLARPLAINATRSVLSAQPAEGARSPRTFLFFDGLTLSVVPAGDGARLLELGELRSENQSLKAELQFPITTELSEASPFERVRFDDRLTTCGFCHQGETAAPDVAASHAFVSPAFRPLPRERVFVRELSAEREACDPEAEPERCAMLEALFRAATPIDHEFPETFKTFL